MLDKEYITAMYKLLHKSYKAYYGYQTLADARKIRKHLEKEFAGSMNSLQVQPLPLLQERFNYLLLQLKIAESKHDKLAPVKELVLLNGVCAEAITVALSPVGVNDYERSVAIYLATKYRHNQVSLNVPVFKNGILAKEFDAVIQGDCPILVEEKMTLDKHGLKSIFDCTPEKKPSHLRVLFDAVIREQNPLPAFEAIHIIFSDIDGRLSKSPRRKVLHNLQYNMSIELPASKFIDLFDGDITLHKAKHMLHALDIRTIVLTKLDQGRIHPQRWSILG